MATKEEGGYDPHDYRTTEKPETNCEAMTNFLKASIGTGVLAMPLAFSNAGWLVGLISTAVVGIVCLYGLHIVISSMYEMCKRRKEPYISFSHAMQYALDEGPPIFACLRPIALPMVDGFLAFYHYCICCVYVVFISNNNKQFCDQYLTEFCLRTHMMFLIVPLLLIFSIHNLKYLAPFAAVANFMTIVGFAIVMYFTCTNMPSLAERPLAADITRYPLYLGVVLFAIEAIGVVLVIEENMKNPKDYVKPLGIMNISMLIVVSLYSLVGFLGYWKFGPSPKGSITLDIPQDQVLPQMVKLVFAFCIYITYSLQGYVTADIIWNKYLKKTVEDESKHLIYELTIRYIIVLCSVATALALPTLGGIVSLVGSFCLSILGMMFPAILQICVQYETGYGPFKHRLIRNILLFIFGLLGGIAGTFVSIKEIAETYH